MVGHTSSQVAAAAATGARRGGLLGLRIFVEAAAEG